MPAPQMFEGKKKKEEKKNTTHQLPISIVE